MKLTRGYRNIMGGISPPVTGLGRYGSVGDEIADEYDVPPEYRGSPVFLNAEVTLDPKTTMDASNEALRNPYDFPIEIHELRFSAYGLQSSVLVRSDQRGSPFPQLGIALTLNDVPVTKDYVPIYSFCPGQGYNAESKGFFLSPVSTTLAYLGGVYSVVLKHPLLLKPREVLRASLQNYGFARGVLAAIPESPGWATVDVGYLGRTREDLAGRLPDQRTVPYFAAWAPSSLLQPASGQAEVSVSASETDLSNQTAGEVRLERFIGRMAAVFGVDRLGVTYYNLSESVGSLDQSYSGFTPGPDSVTVEMTDSHGTPIIAPGTTFRLAFDGLTRTWEVGQVGCVLRPGDYFNARVAVQACLAGETASPSPLLPVIGMTGYREVPL